MKATVTHNSGPASEVAAVVNHHVVTFLVVVHATEAILVSRGDDCDAVNGTMPLQSISNVFGGRCLERLGIGFGKGSDWTGFPRSVAGEKCGVIGTLMVISAHDGIQLVDGVGAWNVALLKVVRAVGLLVLTSQLVQRVGRPVSWVTLPQRTAAARASRGHAG